MQGLLKSLCKKRLVRYKEGAEMYSIGIVRFMELAKECGAVIKINQIALVDLDTFDEYLETFRVKPKGF